MPKKTAAQRLSEKISRYPKLTQSEIYSRMEQGSITPNKMLKYINATEKYNKNLESARAKYEKMFTEQFKKSNMRNTKYFIPTKSGSPRITSAGKTARNLFVQNAMEEVAPSQNKSVVPGKTTLEKYGIDELLRNRQHTASMKGTEYFDWRNDIYFQNWKSAVRKAYEDPELIIQEYDKLSTDEKLAFMATPAGKITYQYSNEEVDAKIEEIFDELVSIRSYSANEFLELTDEVLYTYNIDLSTPEYIQDELDEEWYKNSEELADYYFDE